MGGNMTYKAFLVTATVLIVSACQSVTGTVRPEVTSPRTEIAAFELQGGHQRGYTSYLEDVKTQKGEGHSVFAISSAPYVRGWVTGASNLDVAKQKAYFNCRDALEPGQPDCFIYDIDGQKVAQFPLSVPSYAGRAQAYDWRAITWAEMRTSKAALQPTRSIPDYNVGGAAALEKRGRLDEAKYRDGMRRSDLKSMIVTPRYSIDKVTMASLIGKSMVADTGRYSGYFTDRYMFTYDSVDYGSGFYVLRFNYPWYVLDDAELNRKLLCGATQANFLVRLGEWDGGCDEIAEIKGGVMTIGWSNEILSVTRLVDGNVYGIKWDEVR